MSYAEANDQLDVRLPLLYLRLQSDGCLASHTVDLFSSHVRAVLLVCDCACSVQFHVRARDRHRDHTTTLHSHFGIPCRIWLLTCYLPTADDDWYETSATLCHLLGHTFWYHTHGEFVVAHRSSEWM